jgi:hypothetical protein
LRLPFRHIGGVDFEVYARRGGDKMFSQYLLHPGRPNAAALEHCANLITERFAKMQVV